MKVLNLYAGIGGNSMNTDIKFEKQFDAWCENKNFSYYDSHETMIHLPTRRLHSWASIYERFLKEYEASKKAKRLVKECFS